jgi:bla regulator protein blaR1
MDTLFDAGLANALLASALALVAAPVARLCRRPALAHALWLLVLLKLVTPPLVALPLPWPSAPPAGPDPAGEERPPDAAFALPEAALHLPGGPPEEEKAPAPADPAPAPPAGPPALSWKAAALGVWLAGSLAWWLVAGLRLARFYRLLRGVSPAPAEVQGQAQVLAGLLGLRRCPGVWLVGAPLSPMRLALGWRPRLLVPSALWERLGPAQRDTLLLHELAHLRRGDAWVRRLELVVLGLYWWHPVAWWARRAIQEAEEQCCDSWVVWALPDAAGDYAEALLETVTFLSGARPALPAGASGTGEVPLLKRRLTMILRGPAPRRLSRVGLLCVFGLGLLLLPLMPTGARTQAPARPGVKRPGPETDSPTDRALRKFTAEEKACASCHAVLDLPARLAPASWQKAHDEVIRLRDEVSARRAELAKSERRLKEAIAKLSELNPHAAGGWKGKEAPKSGAPEKRLEDLENKLDRLLKEVEGLRKEMRPKGPAS